MKLPALLLILGALACVWLIVFAWEPLPTGQAGDEPDQTGSIEGSPTNGGLPTAPDAEAEVEGPEKDRRTSHAYETGGVDPAAPKLPPDFDGRTARLAGRVTRGEAGVQAHISIVAGLNREEVPTDATGRFSFDALFPGFARLEVRENEALVRTLDVVVRNRVPGNLRIDLTDEVFIRAIVVDQDDAAIAGVTVFGSRDRTITASDGSFAITVAPDTSVRFAKPGFARREVRAWRGGVPSIRLVPAGSLAISVPAAPWGDSEVDVYAVPVGERVELHPWNRLLPLRVRPGEQVQIDDLPTQKLEVFALGERGVAEPVEIGVSSGSVARIALRFQPLPILNGEVVSADGQAVAGAAVSYRVYDGLEVTALLLGRALRFRRTLPFALAPCVRQDVRTDAAGRFELAVPPMRRTAGIVRVTTGAGAPVRQIVPRDARSLRIRAPR